MVRFDTTWGDFATNNSHIVRINTEWGELATNSSYSWRDCTEWDIIPRRPRRSCRTERCG
ncbi:hypothetical protein [Dermacoccus sp. CCH2-D9]|uniref:hypothetical protein n=1 Tax=Dermacoccus sp. CCH2-D9 TaxID=1768779 RepID=UPI0007816DE0|nr:hypothetical protein [Dermacoccus sp. CCH2-D9]